MSNQNQEEPSAPHGSGSSSESEGGGSDGEPTRDPGAASEDSQSTGHPQNAG